MSAHPRPPPVPPPGPGVPPSPEQAVRFLCWYCRYTHKLDVPARVTIHDRRGCVHCCDAHARARLGAATPADLLLIAPFDGTSMAPGHERGCPEALRTLEGGRR